MRYRKEINVLYKKAAYTYNKTTMEKYLLQLSLMIDDNAHNHIRNVGFDR